MVTDVTTAMSLLQVIRGQRVDAAFVRQVIDTLVMPAIRTMTRLVPQRHSTCARITGIGSGLHSDFAGLEREAFDGPALQGTGRTGDRDGDTFAGRHGDRREPAQMTNRLPVD